MIINENSKDNKLEELTNGLKGAFNKISKSKRIEVRIDNDSLTKGKMINVYSANESDCLEEIKDVADKYFEGKGFDYFEGTSKKYPGIKYRISIERDMKEVEIGIYYKDAFEESSIQLNNLFENYNPEFIEL